MNRGASKYFNTALKMNRAFTDLLAEKDYPYITVSEICKRAGVNRSTFYLHYENMDELLQETARTLLDEFLDCFSPEEKNAALDISGCEPKQLIFIGERYLKPYLNFIREHKEIFATAVAHVDIFGFEKVYDKLFVNIFDPILDRFRYPQTMRAYVMAFYMNGLNAVVMQWIADDCTKSIAEVVKIFEICVFGLQETDE